MPRYQTRLTVTSRNAEGKQVKLAPGNHEFIREIGDKLVARGFAKELVEPDPVLLAEPEKAEVIEAPAAAAKPSAPKSNAKSNVVKSADKIGNEAPAAAAKLGDDA